MLNARLTLVITPELKPHPVPIWRLVAAMASY